MRKTSADVLNDADRAQRIIDWVLFKTEQDARLFAPPKSEMDWVPGEYLYRHPNWRENGEYPRPMFQLYDTDAALATHDTHFFRPPRCDECLVSWYGDEPCWVCGQDIEGETFEKFDPKDHPLIEFSVRANSEGFEQMVRYIQEDMAEHYARAMARLTEGLREFGESLQLTRREMVRYVMWDGNAMLDLGEHPDPRGIIRLEPENIEETNCMWVRHFTDLAITGRESGQAGEFWLESAYYPEQILCPEGFEMPRSMHVSFTPVPLFTSSIHLEERRYPTSEPDWRRS